MSSELERSRGRALPVSPFNASTISSTRSVIFLQAAHLDFSFLQRSNTIGAGERGPDGGHNWNLRGKRGIANDHLVLARNFPARGVNDEVDVAVLDPVENIRTSFVDLKNLGHFNFRFRQRPRRSAGGNNLKTELEKFARDGNDRFLVGIFDADK